MKIKSALRVLIAALSLTAHAQSFYSQAATTDRVTPTVSAPYSTAKTTVTLLYKEPSAQYAASCSLIGAYGFPLISLEKFKDHIVVTITNGPFAVVSGAAEIDCVLTGVVPK